MDGHPVAVLRADAAFLGVQLPRGEHVVSFEYHPRGLFEGLALAGIGVGVLAFWAKGLPG